jgi:hypothetical protein
MNQKQELKLLREQLQKRRERQRMYNKRWRAENLEKARKYMKIYMKKYRKKLSTV